MVRVWSSTRSGKERGVNEWDAGEWRRRVGCRRVERGRVGVKAWDEWVCESVSVSGMKA